MQAEEHPQEGTSSADDDIFQCYLEPALQGEQIKQSLENSVIQHGNSVDESFFEKEQEKSNQSEKVRISEGEEISEEMTQSIVPSQYNSLKVMYGSIEQQTRFLKMELNELFKSKEAESEALNSVIAELKSKLQLMDTQKDKLISDHSKELQRKQNLIISFKGCLEKKESQQKESVENQSRNKARIQQLEQRNEELVARVDDLQIRNKELTIKLEQLDQIIKARIQLEEDHESQKQTLRREYEVKVSQEKQTIRQIVKQKQQKINQIQNALTLISKQKQQKQIEIGKKVKEMQELEKVNDKILNEVLILRKKKEIKKQQVDKQNKLLIHYEKRYQQGCKQIKQLIASNQQKIAAIDLLREDNKEYKCQLSTLNSQLEMQQINKEEQIRRIIDFYNEKSANTVEKYNSFVRQIISTFKQEISNVRIETQEVIANTYKQVVQQVAEFNQELQKPQDKSQKYRSVINESSIINREQMLEFEVEELKKEVSKLKSQNFELKYQRKKYQEKKRNQQNAKELIGSLKIEIERLNAKIKIQDQGTYQEDDIQKQTERGSKPSREITSLVDFGNKTTREKPSKADVNKETRKRKQAASKQVDQKIMQELTEMRSRIKSVRQSCQIRSHQVK